MTASRSVPAEDDVPASGTPAGGASQRRVAPLPLHLAERGLVTVDNATRRALGLAAEAPVALSTPAGRTVVARLASERDAAPDDSVGLDWLIRRSLKASVGTRISLVPATLEDAREALLAPTFPIAGRGRLAERLREVLIARGIPLSDGAYVRLPLDEATAGVVFRVVRVDPTPALATAETRLTIASAEVGLDTDPVTFEDVGGLEGQVRFIRQAIELPLRHPHIYRHLGVVAPRGVLYHGPPGVGKTLLTRALANELDASLFTINGPEIVGTIHGETESNLRNLFAEAAARAPSIILIDEVDAIVPDRHTAATSSDARMVTQLLALMDGLQDIDGVMVIATTNRIEAIDAAARRPGRFDHEIHIGAPDEQGRAEILRIHTRDAPLTEAAQAHLAEIARVTHGMVGADLMAIARQSVLNALRSGMAAGADASVVASSLTIEPEDLDAALADARPSALRAHDALAAEVRLADVGGLAAVKETLRDMVIRPLERPEVFRAMDLQPPRGVLLHGAPGTGKTLLARAIAAESGANLLLIRGTEIFSQWHGESEERVRRLFRLARQVAPAIILLDQLESLAPARGRDTSGGTADRVVSQILAEMDGLPALARVVVIGATDRADLVDPALLQPGRFDVRVHVPLPTEAERAEILLIHLGGVAFEGDRERAVAAIAAETDGLSGAGLRVIAQRARFEALRAVDYERAVQLTAEHLQQALTGYRAEPAAAAGAAISPRGGPRRPRRDRR